MPNSTSVTTTPKNAESDDLFRRLTENVDGSTLPNIDTDFTRSSREADRAGWYALVKDAARARKRRKRVERFAKILWLVGIK